MKPDAPFGRMLRRERAALYCDVSPRKFDELVKAGTLPRARMLDSVKVWCRIDLDAALNALPVDGETPVDDWADA